jgi:hypothetical protein
MKKQVWITEDSFIGATGVNTVHEFAELISTDKNVLDFLDVLALDKELLTVEDIERELNACGVHGILISIAYFYSGAEVWDGSKIHSPVPLDAIPDRGWMKVLGVNL